MNTAVHVLRVVLPACALALSFIHPLSAQDPGAARAIDPPAVLRFGGDPFFAHVAQAQAVAVVSLAARRSYWSPAHDLIFTDYTLQTVGSLRGTTPETFTVTGEGGEVGDVGLKVSDGISFRGDRQYVVLLESTPAGLRVVGDGNGLRELAPAGESRNQLLASLARAMAPATIDGGVR